VIIRNGLRSHRSCATASGLVASPHKIRCWAAGRLQETPIIRRFLRW
jgi:hypothetical protein